MWNIKRKNIYDPHKTERNSQIRDELMIAQREG